MTVVALFVEGQDTPPSFVDEVHVYRDTHTGDGSTIVRFSRPDTHAVFAPLLSIGYESDVLVVVKGRPIAYRITGPIHDIEFRIHDAITAGFSDIFDVVPAEAVKLVWSPVVW